VVVQPDGRLVAVAVAARLTARFVMMHSLVQWWAVGGAVHQASGGAADAEDVEGDAAGVDVRNGPTR